VIEVCGARDDDPSIKANVDAHEVVRPSKQEDLTATTVYRCLCSGRIVCPPELPRETWRSRAAREVARVRSNRTFLISIPALTCAFLECDLASLCLNLLVLARRCCSPHRPFQALFSTHCSSTQRFTLYAEYTHFR
jgi:hypothetical protein